MQTASASALTVEAARQNSTAVQLLDKLDYTIEILNPAIDDTESHQRFNVRAHKSIEGPNGKQQVEVLLMRRSQDITGIKVKVPGYTNWDHDSNLAEIVGKLTIAEACATQGVAAGSIRWDRCNDIVGRIRTAAAEINPRSVAPAA